MTQQAQLAAPEKKPEAQEAEAHAVQEKPESLPLNPQAADDTLFREIARRAKILAQSDIVPPAFQGEKGFANAKLAVDMAIRLGISELTVVQNLYVVYGKPGWASTFIIAMINMLPDFERLNFEITPEFDDKNKEGKPMRNRECRAVTIDKVTGKERRGPPSSIKQAMDQGWWGKKDSKWPDMTELMLQYRAATHFARIHAPELMMGMRSVDELDDIHVDKELTIDTNATRANPMARRETPKTQ